MIKSRFAVAIVPRLLCSALLLSLAFRAGAQTSTETPIATAPPVQAEIYLDNPGALQPAEEERWESSPSSPPLATDDPGTPGRNGYEINFITDCDRANGSHACETGIDAAVGVGNRVQVRISKYATNEADGGVSHSGVGATDIGVKWRFYDRSGLQIATFPSFRIDDATRIHNPDGSMVASDGRSIYLPLIISRDVGNRVTVVANVAYRANIDHPENSSVFTSMAVGRSLSPRSRIMGEVASEATRDARRTDVRIGWVRVLIPSGHSRFQTSFFTSIGHSIGPTDDERGHTTILFGLSVSRAPN